MTVQTAPGAETITETPLSDLEDLFPHEDIDDGKDHKTHIVTEAMNDHIWEAGMNAQDVVDIARAVGEEVVALCGYRWIPKRNPEKYDLCKTCADIWSKAGI